MTFQGSCLCCGARTRWRLRWWFHVRRTCRDVPPDHPRYVRTFGSEVQR